jgi:hypothetical protein
MWRVPVSRRLRAGLAGGATLAVVAGLFAMGVNNGYPAARPQLLSGAAWLASAQVGQLTLLDGSTAEVAAQVQVAKPGERLDVVQESATAYSVNSSAGTIRRVDGASFEVTPPATPLPGARGGLRAFAGPDSLYALDSQRGILTAADPLTLTDRGAPVPLATEISPQAAALDDAGRLWVLDTTTGDLVWIDNGQRHARRSMATPGAGVLVIADGAPVVVDQARRTAELLDPHDASARAILNLDLRPGDRLQVGGSPHSSRLYLVASRGVLDICDLTATTCGSALPLGSADNGDLGAPVETGGRLFVPDYGSGKVWIVDLQQAKVLAQPKILDPKTRFQLLTRDGVVFYNDPNSEHAGVIRLDGGVTAVAKYDPGDPDKGLTGSTGAPEKPQQPPANPAPDNSPSPPSSPPPPPPTPPSNPPSTPNQPDPGTPQGQQLAVQISVSKPTALVGEDVTLKVVGTGTQQPVSARWTFGDNTPYGTGTAVSHHWDSAKTFQVSVTATFANRHTAMASLPFPVTVKRPVLKVAAAAGGTVSGAGIACPPTCAATFDPGQSVTLTAKPDAGSTFAGWSGGCTGAATTCTLTMTADTTVTATFQKGVPIPTVLPAPVLVSPADNAQFFRYPRTTTLKWQAVAGAVKYKVEVLCDTCGASPWTPWITTAVTGTSYTFDWVGDNTGRWRITAIAADGTPGTPSGYRQFKYDTRLAGFAGHWHRVSGSDVMLQAQITPQSATSATLELWGNCGGGQPPCDQGTRTATLSGSTLSATFNFGFKVMTVQITRSGNNIVVNTHNHFTDNSGRADYDTSDTMAQG